MCGIAGSFGGVPERAMPGVVQTVERMVDRLAHRGPDGRGVRRRGDAVLGHTLLSLIDREHAAQPAAGSHWLLSYNGEIYDADAHRRRLQAEGVEFVGHCDTEVLLRLLERHGPAACEEIEGMYAFAATDGDRLWLGRDAFGIKPLLFTLVDDGHRVVFASELKALLADPAVSRRIDRQALTEQATFGHPLEGRTLLAAVRDVPPATVLEIRRGPAGRLEISSHRHSLPAPCATRRLPASIEAAAEELAESLRASVARQRVADHPVGAYLSGGLDSALLVALLAEASRADGEGPVHTFAAADRAEHADLAWARQVADRLGAQHHESLPRPRSLLESLPQAVLDLESTAPPSIAEAGARWLRPHAKAAFSGDGADELFAGYVMHARPGAWLQERAERFNRVVRRGRLRGDGPSAEEAAPTLATLEGLREAARRGEEDLRDATYADFLGA